MNYRNEKKGEENPMEGYDPTNRNFQRTENEEDALTGTNKRKEVGPEYVRDTGKSDEQRMEDELEDEDEEYNRDLENSF